VALRLGGGTTPRGERGDAKDADCPAQRQRNHLSGAHKGEEGKYDKYFSPEPGEGD
jgi:hypothetical protein